MQRRILEDAIVSFVWAEKEIAGSEKNWRRNEDSVQVYIARGVYNRLRLFPINWNCNRNQVFRLFNFKQPQQQPVG